MKRKIIFRADGNSDIGLGHVIRSLALADMLKEEFDCVFIIQKPSHNLMGQINKVCSKVYELPESSDYLTEAGYIADKYLQGGEIVVLDGYGFDTAYQKTIKQKGNKLVCIDDIHDYHFVADVVINHSGGIKAEEYSIEPYTKLCLGTEYALLRKPFLEIAKKERQFNNIENVFICFGGSDHNNHTQKALRACLGLDQIKEIHIAVGSAYRHPRELSKAIKENKNVKRQIHVHSNLAAREMVVVMKKCQLGICSASSIAYEAGTVGMGLICTAYTDNQKNISNFLKEKKYAIVLNDLNKITTDNLQKTIDKFNVKKINTQIKHQQHILKDSTISLKNVFQKL
ncbi:UDP-2,4-diacetamido-2,4,6-trideoxy-beta-L-altropyranose hydrolase, partial [bacterium AH-315-M05]|nr:UDP-2,4-diacetamido-2,4,6-trideoxy-beta-L-altropyranose hydrolase [bacterium AH-315-M05]